MQAPSREVCRPALPDAFDLAALCAAGVLAFYLTFRSGQRGFYAFDQSILFDGSYRVLSGQVPYRDFVMPFGPVAFWLHSLFFRMAGVNYKAYVLGSSTVNVVASFAAAGITWMLAPRARALRYLAAVLTAVWFYPPFGTPWVDQTAFFFGMLALAAVLAGLTTGNTGGLRRSALIAAGGVLAVITFLSKQNVGAFIFPLYPLVIAVAALGRRRELALGLCAFAAGVAVGAAGFLSWLYLRSNPGLFVEHFYRIPAELGSERLGFFVRSWFALREPFFGGRGPVLANAVTIWAFAAGITGLLRAGRAGSDSAMRKRVAVAGMVCAYLAGFQHIFINTTLNQPENGLGFMGVTFGGAAFVTTWLVATGMGRRAAGAMPHLSRGVGGAVALAALCAVVMSLSVSGIRIAMGRKVQDVFQAPAFEKRVSLRGLEHLIWAEPTRLGNFEISGDDFAALLRYLRGRGENFMVFPDFTILYGLAGVPSPQPLLWFHEGVTYLKDDTTELDQWIVRDLRRNDVRVFVLEQVAWFNSGERWAHFPGFRAYIRENFAPVGMVGIFSVYERTGNAGGGQ